MENRDRLRYVDYLKAISMLLVIIGHINFANQSIKAWIYSFHMPAFFFASGLLSVRNTEKSVDNLEQFIVTKFKSLVFPYVGWALIYAQFTFSNIWRILYGSYVTITDSGALSSLWFLLALFISVCMYAILAKLLGHYFNVYTKGIIAACFIILSTLLPKFTIGYPWCFDVSLMATGFYLFGSIASVYLYRITHEYAINKKRVVAVIGIVLGLFGSQLYRINIPSTGYVLMAKSIYGQPCMFVITALFGIILIVSFSIILDTIVSEKWYNLFKYIASNTLCIFAVQKPIILVFQKLFEHISTNTFFALTVTAIGTLIGSCIISKIVNRFTPILVGKV